MGIESPLINLVKQISDLISFEIKSILSNPARTYTSSDIVKTQTPRTVSVQETVIVRVCRQPNVITEPACWRHNLIVTIARSPPPQMSDVERGASRNVRTDTRRLSPNRLPTPDDWDATYTTEAGCVIHHCFAADHTARMLP